MARLKEHYREKVVPGLVEKFGYSSVMAVRGIEKITLNMGIGEAIGDKKILDNAVALAAGMTTNGYLLTGEMLETLAGFAESAATGARALVITGTGKVFSAGADLDEAIRFASRAAALSVTRHGAQSSLPSLAEVEAWRP